MWREKLVQSFSVVVYQEKTNQDRHFAGSSSLPFFVHSIRLICVTKYHPKSSLKETQSDNFMNLSSNGAYQIRQGNFSAPQTFALVRLAKVAWWWSFPRRDLLPLDRRSTGQSFRLAFWFVFDKVQSYQKRRKSISVFAIISKPTEKGIIRRIL